MHYSALLTSNRIFDEEFYDEIAKIKCREISPFKKREIKLSRKFAVIRYWYSLYTWTQNVCRQLYTYIYIYIGNITEVEEKREKGKDINFLE